MGLDMYLHRNTYVKNWDFMGPEERHEVTVLKGGKPHPTIEIEKISSIQEQVAYWRKANHIHAWFVQNVQGGKDECDPAYVSMEQLQELVDICEQVLMDHSLAEELLPPQAGFFFGATEIEEWYFSDLRDTIEQIRPLLAVPADYEYQSSW